MKCLKKVSIIRVRKKSKNSSILKFGFEYVTKNYKSMIKNLCFKFGI
jgi:hypothetical protein